MTPKPDNDNRNDKPKGHERKTQIDKIERALAHLDPTARDKALKFAREKLKDKP